MAERTKILLVEDHTIVREGLRHILSTVPEWEIVGEAEDGLEAVRAVDALEPDIVLMDLSMPRMDGIQATREIKCRRPETRVVALTVHETEGYVRDALEAGVDGFVVKYANKEELLLALRSVRGGKRFLSPLISDTIVKGYLDGNRASSPGPPRDALTPREKQVLKLIAEGYSSKQIAEYLFISVKTVETHRSNLMRKLDLHSAAQLTAYALKRELTLD